MRRNHSDFNKKFEIIQNRISSALLSYEEDRSLMNNAAVEQIMRFKFLSDIGALQQYIEDKDFRKKLQHEVTVLIIGATAASSRRLTLLRGIVNALENVKSNHDDTYSSNEQEFSRAIKRIDDSLSYTREVISKLDELSPDILSLISNSKTDIAYAQNRQLEQKFNLMKHRIKKLNQNLRQSRDDFTNLEIEVLRFKTSQFIDRAKIKELEEENQFLRAARTTIVEETEKKYEKIVEQKRNIIDAQENKILNLECFITELHMLRDDQKEQIEFLDQNQEKEPTQLKLNVLLKSPGVMKTSSSGVQTDPIDRVG